MRCEPLYLACHQEWSPSTTAKADQYSRRGEHTYRCLGDRGSRTQQNHSGVGNRYIPVLLLLLFGHKIDYTTILLHHSAFFKIVDIGSLGVDDRFKVGQLFH